LDSAIVEGEYFKTVRQAGFTVIRVVARHTLTPEELKAMACCPGDEFTPA
jgi:hypothetical protein